MLRRVMVLVVAVVILGLAGCGVEEKTEMNTIEPPEDGWTLELLNQVVYLNGKHITFPLKLSDLGEEYYLTDARDSDIEGLKMSTLLNHSDDRFALSVFYTYEEGEVTIYMIGVLRVIMEEFHKSVYETYLSINDFKLGDSLIEAKNHLGSNYQYYYQDYKLSAGFTLDELDDDMIEYIIFDNGNSIGNIFVFFNENYEKGEITIKLNVPK